ncbi:hypothetical protein [Hoeflea sp.]|uniref:hypothetical protein n=1 Tax=Hoeflea sp. TaxID=1940281 RepID=UPI003A93CD60
MKQRDGDDDQRSTGSLAQRFFSGLLRLLLQFSEIALLQVDVSSSTSRQWFVELTIGLVGRNVEKVQT